MFNLKFIPTQSERNTFNQIKMKAEKAGGDLEIFDALLSTAVSTRKIRKNVLAALKKESPASGPIEKQIIKESVVQNRAWLIKREEVSWQKSIKRNVDALVRFNGDEVKALHYLRIQDLKKLLLILFIALGGVYSSYKLMGGSENGAEDQKDRQVQSQKDLKMYKKLEFVDEKAVKEKLEASLPPKAPEKTSVPAAPVQTRKTNSVAQPRVKQEHADQRPTAEPDAESIFKMSGSSHAKKPALIAVPNSSAPQREPIAAPAKPATPPPYQKVKSRTVQEAENAVKD